ncbi:alpha/beta hydrolase [Streptomyces roseirectus]|uniref:Alpha/beta hydrolase n=2 Tax=Streptomyces roseirectus TaxID=2768066 RepID=A0A7H0IT04_9ACTN|nr:alpha/beta hydrolase [Streptomyces roseirectus]
MVAVDGGQLWAEERGSGEGPPLVLLHPGVGDSEIWDPVLDALASRRRVIRYDVRGYGRSPAPEGPYRQDADLAVLLDHFGVTRAVLVGNSMGGSTAIAYTLDHPEQVAALGLLVPGVAGYPEPDPPELAAQVEPLALAGDLDGLADLAMSWWGGAGTPPDTEARRLLRGVLKGWFTSYQHEQQLPSCFERLGELTLPCSLLLGELDQRVVVDRNEVIAARIPGCRLVRAGACDHFPTLRVPGAVVELVEELYLRLG